MQTGSPYLPKRRKIVSLISWREGYSNSRTLKWYAKLVENIKRVVWYCGREIALEFATLRQDQSTSFWIWKASVENVVYEDHWLVLGARSVELWVHV